jgi:hypothetical protein
MWRDRRCAFFLATQDAEARLAPPAAAAKAAAASAGTQHLRQLRQTISLARLALCRSLAASQMAAPVSLM